MKIVYILVFALMACSSEVKTPRETSSADIDTDDSTNKKNSSGEFDPLSISGFAWGPYSAKDEGVSKGIAWENGYLGMRQRKGDDQIDLQDYRWYSSTVASGTKLLSQLSGTGCRDLPALSNLVGGDYLESVTYSGGFTDDVEENSGIYSLGEKGESDFIFTPQDEVTAKFVTSDGTQEVKAPDTPTGSQISLTGATASSLSVNTVMSILNSNLEGRTTDLTINDKGDGQSYNSVVVIFFPGSKADSGPIMCVLEPQGSVDVTADEFQSWLPLKGFIAFSAMTSLADGIWTSRYRGEGVEDLAVP